MSMAAYEKPSYDLPSAEVRSSRWHPSCIPIHAWYSIKVHEQMSIPIKYSIQKCQVVETLILTSHCLWCG